MKKRQKQIVVGIIVLIVVAFFLSQVGFNQPLAISGLDSQLGQCSGGFTSFSIDKVTINNDKSRIRVYGVAKGSECLNIQLSASQLNNELSGEDVKATRSVVGEIRLKEYTKTFPIDRTGNSFTSIVSKNIGKTLTCTNSRCQSTASSGTFTNYRDWNLDCYCVYTGSNGLEGTFSSARSYGNFKVDFTIDGKTSTLSREQQSVNIGNHHIEWTGNLMNLDEISPPGYDARLLFSTYDLVQDGARNAIESKVQTFKNCFSTPSVSYWSSCKSSFDSSSNSILSSKLSQYISSNSALIYDAKTDSNNLYVSLKATPYPTFILDLDASDVGIIALEGKPDITSCIQSQPDLKSGDNKVVSFSVKNTADASGVEFFSSISCGSGVIGFIPNFNINANQEKTISAELIPSNPQESDLTTNCKLKVTDLKSGNSDSCSFSATIKYESGIICEPNGLSCNEDFTKLIQCTYDGKNKVVKEECENGCEITSTGAKCRGEIEPPSDGKCESCDAFVRSKVLGSFMESQKCEPTLLAIPPQTNTLCFVSWIKLGLVPIILIFVSLFSFNFFQTNKQLRIKNKFLAFLVGLILASLLAYLTFMLFWAGLIISSIILIIIIVLKVVL